MTATLKTVITRPSLDGVFFFESLIYFNLIPNFDFDSYVSSAGPGFIDTTIETPITWEEIESRKAELRPDLIDLLKYKNLVNPMLNDKSKNIMWTLGINGEPPFNPFSLTYTFQHHYETYDQLITNYNANLKDRVLNFKSLILQTNNIGLERCFVDGVEVEFIGAFDEISRLEK